MYFKYSTGLIPPKKSRGKAVKEGKTTATTQKLTKPKKKPSKERQVLHDESPESEGEPENRKVSIKIRTPRAVVIQEPPAKKTQDSSKKLKGIEMLSEAALLGIDTQTTIKDNQHASPLKNKTRSLSEGTGVSPGVPDELTGVLEEDEEKSVNEEENVDEENEEESDDNDKSFDITNTDDEITKSDSDDHEISKEGETVFEIEEEEIANSEHEEDDTKGEDQKTEEEPKRDDQANEAEVGVPDLVTNKEKSEFLQSTSSHSISLNFDVPLVQNEPFHEVKVSIIPKSTQQPPSTPPLPVIEDPAALVINFEDVDSFLHKFHALEKDVQELKQADHSAAILESIKSQVSSIVKDSLALNIGDELQKVLQSHTEGLKKELTVKKA
ncbi:hypothetical protein Tco_0218936 [Tanacetum coccineum]